MPAVMSHDWRLWRSLGAFAVAGAAIYGLSAVIVGLPEFGQPGSAIPLAVSLDLTAGIVAAAFLFLVRGARVPAIVLGPLFLLSVTAASWVLPAGRQGVLDWAAPVAVAVELAVAGFLVSRIRRIRLRYGAIARASASPDLLTDLDFALAGEVGSRVAALLAGELAVVGYLLRGWRAPARPGTGTMMFSTYRNWAPLAFGILFLIGVETLAVHLLLSLWNPALATLVTALGLYAMVWLLADLLAARQRPILLTRDELIVRCGLRWTATIALTNIDSVERIHGLGRRQDSSALNLAPDMQPGLLLTLREPNSVRALFGRVPRSDQIGLGVDDPVGLGAALSVAISER